MRIFLLLVLVSLSLFAQKVLVINSNSAIVKYANVEKSFRDSFKEEYMSIDISKMSTNEIKEYLYDEYPDIVYAIGAKAYQYANRYIPEKKIFFSSIVNYKRLGELENRYGISNEVHSGMKLTLIRTMFPKIKKLKLLYSKYTKDIFEEHKRMGEIVGIEIVGKNISDSDFKTVFDNAIDIDGYILIPDPILIKDEKRLKTLFEELNKLKKPIFSYHELFIKFGAILSVSVDNPTVGRQVASMINSYLYNGIYDNIQMPMGTSIVLNKKILEQYKIGYDKSILSIVNKVVE